MARNWTGRSLSLSAAVMLAACGLVPLDGGSQSRPAETASATPAPAATPVPAGPVPRPPPPKPAPPAEAQPGIDQVKLVGLTRTETQELLGPPLIESEAGAAKVWQYRSGTCQLDVFFSYELARADFYVLSYSINRGNGSSDAERQCLTRLAHDRAR